MIVIEEVEIRNKSYKKTYSDEGYKLRQIETGLIYDEAIDMLESNYTYEEIDELIEEEAIEEDYIEALNQLGVSE